MIFDEACRILSLSGGESRTEIKKRYRQIMHQVHPDVIGSKESSFQFDAWEINAAYEVLMGNAPATSEKAKSSHFNKRWQAPENEHAYIERDIFVDHISIASGKYYYSEEETFPMFLYSIYHCSKKVLESFPDSVIQKYLGETAYLLSQQFVNREMVLSRYEADEGPVYYFPAMLESEGRRYAYPPGTVLVPGRVHNHRLYLNSASSGKEVGYISFHDDLVYYALIPLFEQRRAEMKVRVSGSAIGNNNVRAVKVRTLDLWIRLKSNNMKQIEVRLSDQIEAIIRKCREERF